LRVTRSTATIADAFGAVAAAMTIAARAMRLNLHAASFSPCFCRRRRLARGRFDLTRVAAVMAA
jgi:hypothetical protein